MAGPISVTHVDIICLMEISDFYRLVYMFLIRYDKLTMFFMCFTSMVSFTSSYDMTNCTLGLLSGNFSPDKTVEFQWVK